METVRDVVLGVVRAALRERDLVSIVVLRPETPGHDLVMDWLSEWRDRADSGPPDPPPVGVPPDVPAGLTLATLDRAPAVRDSVVLDPAPKEVVLLDGPLPGADVLPLGDVWGSRVATRDAGSPLTPVERALAAVFEGAEGLDALARLLPSVEAASVRRRLLRTAPLLRAPVVPKLTEWTAGIDPGP